MSKLATARICTGLAIAAVLAFSIPAIAGDAPARSGSWRSYDAQGRYAGTAYRTGADRIRFYDEKGRYAGSAYQRADGLWRSYDRSGRYSGTAKPSRTKRK